MKTGFRVLVFAMIFLLIVPTTVQAAAATVKLPNTRSISLYQIEGDDDGVTVERGAKKSFTGKEGAKLGAGDTIITNKNTVCYISIDSDKIIKLDKITIISVSKASSKKMKITLDSGELYFDVQKPVQADSELEFRSGGAVMGVRGTNGTFGNVDGAVKSTIYTGHVIIETQAGQKIELAAGNYQVIKADGTPEGAPKPIDVEKMTGFELKTLVEEITKPVTTKEEQQRQDQIKETLQVTTAKDVENLQKIAEVVKEKEVVQEIQKQAEADKAKEELQNKTETSKPTVTNPPVGTASTPPPTHGGGGSSSGSTPPTPPIVPDRNVTDEASLVAAMGDTTVKTATIPTGATVKLTKALTVGTGKTLIVAQGGTLDATNGKLSILGTLTNNSDTTLKLGADSLELLVGAKFENNGSITGSSPDVITVSGNDVTIINGLGKTITGDIKVNTSGTCSITNNGTMANIYNSGNMGTIANNNGAAMGGINNATGAGITNINNKGHMTSSTANVDNFGQITNITNAGTMSADITCIRNNNGAVIVKFENTNSGQGSLSGEEVDIQNYSYITQLSNKGIILAISNESTGTIEELINNGTIMTISNTGAGKITKLSNHRTIGGVSGAFINEGVISELENTGTIGLIEGGTSTAAKMTFDGSTTLVGLNISNFKDINNNKPTSVTGKTFTWTGTEWHEAVQESEDSLASAKLVRTGATVQTYSTVSAALEAATSGDTVEIVNGGALDEAATVKAQTRLRIPEGVSLEIEDGNLTIEGAVDNYGTLTITNDGKVTSEDAKPGLINQNGTMTAPTGQVSAEDGSDITNMASGVSYVWNGRDKFQKAEELSVLGENFTIEVNRTRFVDRSKESILVSGQSVVDGTLVIWGTLKGNAGSNLQIGTNGIVIGITDNFYDSDGTTKATSFRGKTFVWKTDRWEEHRIDSI